MPGISLFAIVLNGRLYIPITDKHSIEHLLGSLPQFTYIRVSDVPADLVSRLDGTDLSDKHIGLNNKSLYIIISPLGGRHLDLFLGRRGLGDRWAVLHTARSEQMLKARTYGIVIVKRSRIGMFKIYLSNNVFETYRVMCTCI